MHSAPRAALKLALVAAMLGTGLGLGEGASAAGERGARQAVPQRGATATLTPVAGEVIVRFKAGAATLKQHALDARAKPQQASEALGKRAATLGARVGRALEGGEAVGERTQVVRQAGADAAELARHLAADPEVEFAVPNGRQRRLQVPPNDPLYPFASRQPNGPDAGQWYLRPPDLTFPSSINAQAAWARGFGSGSVVVAVLDTGVRFEHPDLGRVAAGGRLLDGYDFVTDATVANDGDGRDADPSDPGDWVSDADRATATFSDCEASDSSWHGTATASIVGAAANNAMGMAGVAPGVLVLPVRVLGKCFGKDSDIQAAMRWSAGIHVDGVPDNPNPAKVINMSLGSTGACSSSYQAAVNEIVARGVVIVVAAGNSDGEPVGTPANCDGVVAVGGLRHVGTKSLFADLGAQMAISAPAGNCVNIRQGEPCLYPIIFALDAGLTTPVTFTWSDSYDYALGTSFSSPLVAGAAGLVFSQNPSLTVAQVRALLQGTARPFPTSGGTAGTPACAEPAAGKAQLECYCPNAGTVGYPLCGAGMLDAGAAVNAAVGGLAVIDSNPSAPVKGQTFTFGSSGSIAGVGRTIVGWAWTLVSGGGAVAGFTSATNAASVTVSPAATGTIVVRLTLTDNTGASTSTTASVAVGEPPPAAEGGKGGGALSVLWLALLALAVAALAGLQRRRNIEPLKAPQRKA